jgi:uncharacterized protein
VLNGLTKMFDLGFNPNIIIRTDTNLTPLVLAACKLNFNIVKILVKHGANLHHLMKSVDGNLTHKTILHLVAAGITVDEKPGEITTMIMLLLKLSPDLINMQTSQGATALHFAAKKGYFDVVKLLIARGADPTIKTKTNNKTAARLAGQMGHYKISIYLSNLKK